MADISVLVLAGAFFGGLVSGLTGFGTGLTALPFWIHAMPPLLASPLVVVCSVVAQLQTLPAIWHAVELRRIMPFVIGGVLGVPIGIALLPHISVQAFKAGLGLLLVVSCGFFLLTKVRFAVRWGGRLADAASGFGGGVLGGLAGLAGPLPTVWTGVRGWDKDTRRAVLQGFNLSILAFTLVLQTAAGLVTVELSKMLLSALPGTLFGAWCGRRLYGRLDTRGFERIVLLLLATAGIGLILTSL